MPQTGREHFGLEQRADSPVLFARNPSGAVTPGACPLSLLSVQIDD